MNDAFSFIMMLNKMHEVADFARWKEEVNLQYLEEVVKETPQYLLGSISQVAKALLININVPIEEAEGVADRIKERDMAGLFDHFEKYDVQATRTEARAEGQKQEREEGIRKLVESAKELGADEEKTCQQVMKQYELTESEAIEKVKSYWN